MTSTELAGFSDSDKAMQDAFAALQKELLAKKVNWESSQKVWSALIAIFKDVILKDIEFSERNIDLFIAFLDILIGQQTAQLGIELTEVHNRLTVVEKAIKTLKSMQ